MSVHNGFGEQKCRLELQQLKSGTAQNNFGLREKSDIATNLSVYICKRRPLHDVQQLSGFRTFLDSVRWKIPMQCFRFGFGISVVKQSKYMKVLGPTFNVDDCGVL